MRVIFNDLYDDSIVVSEISSFYSYFDDDNHLVVCFFTLSGDEWGCRQMTKFQYQDLAKQLFVANYLDLTQYSFYRESDLEDD